MQCTHVDPRTRTHNTWLFEKLSIALVNGPQQHVSIAFFLVVFGESLDLTHRLLIPCRWHSQYISSSRALRCVLSYAIVGRVLRLLWAWCVYCYHRAFDFSNSDLLYTMYQCLFKRNLNRFQVLKIDRWPLQFDTKSDEARTRIQIRLLECLLKDRPKKQIYTSLRTIETRNMCAFDGDWACVRVFAQPCTFLYLSTTGW